MKICLAPMDGVTDCAYRIICKQVFERRGNKDDELMLWTEFMSVNGYYHNPPGVVRHLMKTEYDHETILQIFGGEADMLIHCALDCEKKYNFSGIELNMGCPSPKIMKCAAGSGMLRDKEKTLEILKTISGELSTPFSLKTRLGLTQDDVEEQFEFLLEASKYVRMIGVHGRTYKQSHRGFVDRDFIYRLKEALPEKVIIGNGGLRSYQDCVEKCQNLDGMMPAQSAIGNPWILTPHTPSISERYEIIISHLQLSVAAELYFKKTVAEYDQHDHFVQPSYQDLQEIIHRMQTEGLTEEENSQLRSPVEFRTYLFNYISGLTGSKEVKRAIARMREYDGLVEILREYFEDLESANIAYVSI